MDLCIQTLAEIVGGKLSISEMPPLGGVCEPIGNLVTDPSRIGPGDVLVVSDTLRGECPCCEFDAFGRGAVGAIGTSSQIEPPAGGFYLQVDDVAWSLWQLAKAFRANYEGQVIAVAGSVGKTTTAAMIATLLGVPFELHNSTNVQHSLAEQLLQLKNETPFSIVELHADAPGELEAAMHLCCPHVAAVIDPQEYTEASRRSRDSFWVELRSALPDNGTFVEGPSSLSGVASPDRVNALSFGRDAGCDIFATHVCSTGGTLQFVVDGRVSQLNVWGRHFLDNALAAWAVGRAVGLTEDGIATRLARFATPRQRCEVVSVGDGKFIDDTACHSPLARRAALELLSTLDGDRRVVVCSEAQIAEGEQHRWGTSIVEVAGADAVVTIGGGNITRGAIDAGMPPSRCHCCTASADVNKEITEFLCSGDNVLLTGVDAEVAQQVLALFQNTVSATTAQAAAA